MTNNTAFPLDWLLWLVLITIFSYFNRELEIMRIIKEIESYIILFKQIRDKAVSTVIKAFRKEAAKEGNVIDIKFLEARVIDLIESEVIEPVKLDPYGIVAKLKHLLVTTDENLSLEIKRIVPNITTPMLENLKNLIGSAKVLNYYYKALDHDYRRGKKFKSIWILYQLQALLPFITETVRAVESNVEAVSKGFPIGDSAGPLTVVRFALKNGFNLEPKQIADKTVLLEGTYRGRRVIIIKAEGPGGSVGRLDDAIMKVFEIEDKISAIVTVDAALKLESEKTGTIVSGIGVAMGGIGVEKFNIEKIATEKKIPLYAVLIKMSIPEAYATMDKNISEAIDKAIERIERTIEEKTHEGDTVLLIGVGNTIGVYP